MVAPTTTVTAVDGLLVTVPSKLVSIAVRL
jgi:hypothetical protein